MTEFSGSPRLVKGAIIGADQFNPLASIVIFQYNPDQVTRTVTALAGGENADRAEILRLRGAPTETIRLEVEIDAADQLAGAEGRTLATTLGIYPALASLEMLLYPKSARIIANEIKLALGSIEVIPPEAPLTLLVWGLQRVLPVRLTQLTITEEAFDPNLNPIRAKVSLDVRVLTYSDLGVKSVGGALYLANQVFKETLATIAGIKNLGSLRSLTPF